MKTKAVTAIIVLLALFSLAPSLYLPLVRKDTPLTSTPTITNTATLPPTATPTNTPIPQPTATNTPKPGVCNCTGPDLDCGDFGTQKKAQACYDYCKSLGYGDIFHLDGDGDGKACESLP